MTTEQQNPSGQVQLIEITEDHTEQRLDNFLITRLKGVPKSRIYRIVRKGEVRVNKGRVDVNYRLAAGDIVRIPPIRQAENTAEIPPVSRQLINVINNQILFEDESLLIINKPAGIPVHGGSGVQVGVIEGLRQLRPECRFLDLAHRLDRDTSGCLLIAKKRSALRSLHGQFRDDTIHKSYLALLSGQWARKKLVVNQPLLKNVNKGGERIVVINQHGKESETLFRRLKLFQDATLVQATPKTGRTHQIRVHAAYLGHPIIGDDRYGLSDCNKTFRNRGYKHMFLHAETLQFQHPASERTVNVTAPLPPHFLDFITHEKQV
ncbi:MAG: 23S rRNA pseudouridine(955/2504/2580) synthase RluC [Gammaproteobacteria bacterium]|nr:23S rRNA pseudouridine(955/2504/2580) synthase RluC [Gammaproteobacteria bacterium]